MGAHYYGGAHVMGVYLSKVFFYRGARSSQPCCRFTQLFGVLFPDVGQLGKKKEKLINRPKYPCLSLSQALLGSAWIAAAFQESAFSTSFFSFSFSLRSALLHLPVSLSVVSCTVHKIHYYFERPHSTHFKGPFG